MWLVEEQDDTSVCTVCGKEPKAGRALCADCERRLGNAPGLCLEQIGWFGETPSATRAILVDQWGRGHSLHDATLVGRVVENGIAVLEASISRHHAKITCENDAWFIHDLGSRNGTRVDTLVVDDKFALKSDQIVTFGDVAFYFLVRPTPVRIADLAIETRKGSERRVDSSTGPIFRLASPEGNVGGIVEFNGSILRLSAIQFALVSMLAERIVDEAEKSALVRGYVSSAELCDKLPWDTAFPVADNVKQLLRRVRSAMVTARFGDLIESRRRFGYRLRVVPCE